jgi:hypothetical protein
MVMVLLMAYSLCYLHSFDSKTLTSKVQNQSNFYKEKWMDARKLYYILWNYLLNYGHIG